jgi:hypothetical protein
MRSSLSRTPTGIARSWPARTGGWCVPGGAAIQYLNR